jgi:hypothetical protein
MANAQTMRGVWRYVHPDSLGIENLLRGVQEKAACPDCKKPIRGAKRTSSRGAAESKGESVSKTTPRYPGYTTAGMGQAASYVVEMVKTRDKNRQARIAGYVLLLLSDADKAFGEVAGIIEANEQYHGLLKLVEEAGITLLSTDPEQPLSIPDTEDAQSPEEVSK